MTERLLNGNLTAWNYADYLVNSGTISGDIYTGLNFDTLRNTGVIGGDVTFGDSYLLVNRGTIHGDVKLGDGGGTFDGRRGVVDGTITGDTGVDTIRAGNDGKTLGGGGGHDVLYGGLGDDTFQFSSLQSADTDVVHQFNVTHDTIELAHSAYARLVAGKTPTFVVGTASNGPTDYLFYNATTGGLYYDVDGSTSK